LDSAAFLFTFEDLRKFDDRGIQQLLKEVPRDQLCLSLKLASDDLQQLLLRNVSKRAAELIEEQLDSLGKVRKKDAEKAAQIIVDTARRLMDSGEISLQSHDSGEEWV